MTIPNDNVPTLPFLHQNMPDRPNTVFPSSLALKQAFDSSTQALQTAINNLVADLQASGSGISAAEFIGSATVPAVTGNTVWSQLVFMSAQIQAIVGATIPPQSVTSSMIQDGAVTYTKLEPKLQAGSVGGLLYAYKNLGGAI